MNILQIVTKHAQDMRQQMDVPWDKWLLLNQQKHWPHERIAPQEHFQPRKDKQETLAKN